MAQTDRATHKAYVNTNIVDNTSNDITGSEVNKSIIDLHDSVVWYDELPNVVESDWRQVTAENVDVTAAFPTYQKITELPFPLQAGGRIYYVEVDVIFNAAAVTATEQLVHFKIDVEYGTGTKKEYIMAEKHIGIARTTTFRTYSMPVAITDIGTAKVTFYSALELGEQDVTIEEVHISMERKQ